MEKKQESSLEVCPSHSGQVAETIRKALDSSFRKFGRVSLAIPGGSSPLAVLPLLAGMLPASLSSSLHLFWVDERAVPRDLPERNDSATLKAWREGGDLPGHLHPLPAEKADLEEAAREYAETLRRILQGRPLDICLLGIGEDGHIGSLFPHHPALKEAGPVLAIYDSPKPPPRRLTLSLPFISQAGRRIVLAPGEAKAKVYHQAVRGPDESIPVSLLPRRNTIWFVDL